MQRHLTQAIKVASKSQHLVHLMGAVVVRGGQVISSAHNLGSGRGHAEARALRPHRDFKGADLFVVRLNGRRTSRPCYNCAKLIAKAGITTITYTDDTGVICRITARELLLLTSLARW